MTRRTATLLWAALAVVPLVFLAVASGIARHAVARGLTRPVFWLALGASALNVVLSRALPCRLGPARALDRDAVAFTRHLVSLALCEAAAMAPLVGYMLTGDVGLLVVVALDVIALVSLFPSDARWEALRPESHGAPAPRTMVR